MPPLVHEPVEPLDFPLESPVDVWLASLNWDELSDFTSATAAWNSIKDGDTPDGFAKARRKGNVWWESFKAKFETVVSEETEAA